MKENIGMYVLYKEGLSNYGVGLIYDIQTEKDKEGYFVKIRIGEVSSYSNIMIYHTNDKYITIFIGIKQILKIFYEKDGQIIEK